MGKTNKKEVVTTPAVTVKGYKGFNAGWACRDKQYKPGETYTEDKASLCNTGLHFVENPADLFDYYGPVGKNGQINKFAVVTAENVSDERSDDSKRVCKKLIIGAELSFADIVKARIEYVREHTTEEHADSKLATAGDGGAATSRGSVFVGENGCGLARGNNVKAKGGLGAILVLCEENDSDCDIKAWKAFVVDGKTIKTDTWYELVNGEVRECEQ